MDIVLMIARMDQLASAKGWSRSQVLRQIPLTTTAANDWKAGKSSPEKHLDRIAEILNTTVEYLKGETDNSMRILNATDEEAMLAEILDDMGVFNDDGTINQKGLEYLKACVDMYKRFMK